LTELILRFNEVATALESTAPNVERLQDCHRDGIGLRGFYRLDSFPVRGANIWPCAVLWGLHTAGGGSLPVHA